MAFVSGGSGEDGGGCCDGDLLRGWRCGVLGGGCCLRGGLLSAWRCGVLGGARYFEPTHQQQR